MEILMNELRKQSNERVEEAEQEPAAWLMQKDSGEKQATLLNEEEFKKAYDNYEGYNWSPLYTHPPKSKA